MKLVEVYGSVIRAVEEPWTPLLADEAEFARLNSQHRENVQLIRPLDPQNYSVKNSPQEQTAYELHGR